MRLSKESKARMLAWWDGQGADRPCILAAAHDMSGAPLIRSSTSADEYWLNPDVLVKETRDRLHNRRFFGEALPVVYVDYGASAVALQFGAEARWTDKETIWANPSPHSLYDIPGLKPSGNWNELQTRAMRLAMSAYAKETLIGSYCMGAAADTTAALIGTEKLLYALVDEPDEVHAAFEAVKRDWIERFERMAAECAKAGGALNGWHAIWSPEPTAPIQEDFSYMIGADMFDEFCLPHIADIVDAVPYSFYHLDGVGALKHLKSLCKIPNLRAIQWQPGDGHMEPLQWVDVIREIICSGKACQLYVRAHEVTPLLREVGSDRLLLIVNDSLERIYRLADEYKLCENLWED